MSVVQRNATNNQSTADYQFLKMFIFDNRFEKGIFKQAATGLQNSGNLQTGMLVARDTATPGQYIPVTSANLADVVGVVAMEDNVIAVAANGTQQIAICTKGDVDSNLFVLPATVTLDTAVGNKALRDVLEAIGLHLVNGTVDNTNFDN